MSITDLLKRLRGRDPNRSDLRALIDQATGADTVRAARRQMATGGRPSAVRHRTAARRGHVQD